MKSCEILELKKYSYDELKKMFSNNVDDIIRKLLQYSILKKIKKDINNKDLTELSEEDEIVDSSIDFDDVYFVFKYVGIILIQNLVIMCYPKYLNEDFEIQKESKDYKLKIFKQIIKVIEKVSNSKEEKLKIFDPFINLQSVNKLYILLSIIRDYQEYGLYENRKNIIKNNGNGEILWDKTINETFAILNNNKPYYFELKTIFKENDDCNFFTNLHKSIISECYKELNNLNLCKIFEINNDILLTENNVQSFGENDYILYKLQNEINVQFNTHKQFVLKMMFSYIATKYNASNTDISFYGTSSFNLVWEKVLKEVFRDNLNNTVSNLIKEDYINNDNRDYYNSIKDKTLKDLIDKPIWKSEDIEKEKDTLIPDLICVDNTKFIIIDAKYYNISFYNKDVIGQPGIESITKQYLYRLSYKDFCNEFKFNVSNYFIMPTSKDNIEQYGSVELSFLKSLGLDEIKIIKYPAEKLFSAFLSNEKNQFDENLD